MDDYKSNPKFLVIHPSSSSSKKSNSRTFVLKIFSKSGKNGQIFCADSSSYTFSDPLDKSDNHNCIQVFGSCDGLVCMYDLKYIYLINPETKQHQTLSPTFVQHPSLRSSKLSGLPFTIGFGKDIITRSYKVILMYLYEFDTTYHYIRVKTKILNLDNGEQRDAGFFPVYSNQLCEEQTSVFANGSLFWLTLPFWRWQKPPKLVAMDLHTEKFRRVTLPNWYIHYSRGMRMWTLDDRLCLSNVLQSPNLDVWSLQKEVPSEKWEKMFSFNILNISHQDAKFWTLGLAAAYFRRTGDRKPPRDQTSLDRLRAISYSPTLISPFQESSSTLML